MTTIAFSLGDVPALWWLVLSTATIGFGWSVVDDLRSTRLDDGITSSRPDPTETDQPAREPQPVAHPAVETRPPTPPQPARTTEFVDMSDLAGSNTLAVREPQCRHCASFELDIAVHEWTCVRCGQATDPAGTIEIRVRSNPAPIANLQQQPSVGQEPNQ